MEYDVSQLINNKAMHDIVYCAQMNAFPKILCTFERWFSRVNEYEIGLKILKGP